jgi:hypothetical protein
MYFFASLALLFGSGSVDVVTLSLRKRKSLSVENGEVRATSNHSRSFHYTNSQSQRCFSAIHSVFTTAGKPCAGVTCRASLLPITLWLRGGVRAPSSLFTSWIYEDPVRTQKLMLRRFCRISESTLHRHIAEAQPIHRRWLIPKQTRARHPHHPRPGQHICPSQIERNQHP